MLERSSSLFKLSVRILLRLAILYGVISIVLIVYFNLRFVADKGIGKWAEFEGVMPTIRGVFWPYYSVRDTFGDQRYYSTKYDVIAHIDEQKQQVKILATETGGMKALSFIYNNCAIIDDSEWMCGSESDGQSWHAKGDNLLVRNQSGELLLEKKYWTRRDKTTPADDAFARTLASIPNAAPPRPPFRLQPSNGSIGSRHYLGNTQAGPVELVIRVNEEKQEVRIIMTLIQTGRSANAAYSNCTVVGPSEWTCTEDTTTVNVKGDSLHLIGKEGDFLFTAQ
jgi:hypothetical protein